VGLGLSEDTSMGDDSVIECVYENGVVTAYTSLTRRGEGNYGSDRFRVVRKMISFFLSTTTTTTKKNFKSKN
jgi:hypothetical protein